MSWSENCRGCMYENACDFDSCRISEIHKRGNFIYEKAVKDTIKWFLENGYKYNLEGAHYLIKNSHRTMEEEIEYFIKEMNE